MNSMMCEAGTKALWYTFCAVAWVIFFEGGAGDAQRVSVGDRGVEEPDWLALSDMLV